MKPLTAACAPCCAAGCWGRYCTCHWRAWPPTSISSLTTATARTHVELTLPEGKQAVYRESVRAGMEDFIAAIRDPRHTPEITATDGRNSLAVALAATRAAETDIWETISL